MLEGLVEEVYNIRKKEYIYKRDARAQLVTEVGGTRLADRDVGSAVANFRKNQILKSKFPVDFWKF